MSRIRDWRSRLKPVLLIWTATALLIFLGFRAALENTQSPSFTSPDFAMSSFDRRARLYDKMERDLEKKGAVFLKGNTSQALSLSDIFELKDGVVKPVLKAINPPVRANVLYMRPEYSEPISQIIKNIFLPYFDKVIWFQNTSFFHSSLFHASHHSTPISATDDEIEQEALAVKSLADTLCPIKVVLDRVVLTSTGVIMGCWQVASGPDPSVIRTKLRSVLPHAPEKQFYDPDILHTSLARLLGRPSGPEEEVQKRGDQIKFFYNLVERANKELRGFQAVFSELWYVEEFDMLALALDGKMKAHKFHLGCSGDDLSPES